MNDLTFRSGDPTNREAQAARVYWAHWLPEGPFRRDQDATTEQEKK